MPTLTRLLTALDDLTATEPRPEALATADALRAAAAAAAAASFPRQPSTALAAGIQRAGLLAHLIRKAQPCLPWQDSPAASLQPTSLRAIKSVVTLLGPDAPIASGSLLFGFFYQTPDSDYPLHAHQAAETYTLLSGTAQWQAGHRRLTLSAGEAIHHSPNLSHAMYAGPDGFVAMWRWSGDISFDSYRRFPDP